MIASRSSILPLALAAILAGPGILFASQASAQDLCADNGALMQGAKQAQISRALEIEQHARDIYGPMARSPEWLSGAQSELANCIADQFDGWQSSTGNGLFDRVANAAIDRAIDEACAEQRKRVADYTAQAAGYLDRIPDFKGLGSQPIQLPDGDIGGLSYDEVLRRIREGYQGNPTNPTNPGNPSNPGIPGVGNPRPNPPGGGGIPGIIP